MDQTPDRQTRTVTAPRWTRGFYGSILLLSIVLGGSALAPIWLTSCSQNQNGIVVNGSWYYVLVVAIILVSSLVIALTRYGDIKLVR